MLLARFLSKTFKTGGIILIDSKGQKYICGNPDKEKPLTLKLLKKDYPICKKLYSDLHKLDEKIQEISKLADNSK